MRNKVSSTALAAHVSRTHAERPSTHVSVAAAVILLAAASIAIGCRKDPLAGLAELPADSASNLQIVPGRALLATQIRSKAAPSTQAPPPCAADSTSTYYDARITVPITLCWNFDLTEVAVYDQGIMPPGAAITHNKLSSGSTAANPAGFAVMRFPLFCSTSDGPWSADLESDRECVGICGPQNSLTVIGIPNLVQFFWAGQYDVPPLGAPFKFVGAPTQVDSVDRGRCHPENERGDAQGKR